MVIKRLEESIKEDLNIKRELIDENLDDEQLEKKQTDSTLNSGTRELLNKYRRESVTSVPYAESFFGPDKSMKKADSIGSDTKSKNYLSR